MAIEIIVPKLGLTMEEAVLVSWSFAPGDKVAKDQTVLVLETDKVSYELPSPGDGLLHPLVAPGATVKVSQVVGYLAGDQAELATLRAEPPAAETDKAQPAAAALDSRASKDRRTPSPASADLAPKRIKASPLARAMAAKEGLDLASIVGSGPAGRIVKADILRALAGVQPAVATAGAGADSPTLTPTQEIPITGIRKAIFQNMHHSLSSQAQLTLHTEASAANLVRLRRKLNQRQGKDATKVSFNALIVKAAALALRLHPLINASVEGEALKVWRQINIGVAMDLGNGLVVPKLRHPDQKGVRAISQEILVLAERAQAKKLTLADLAGGTFTVTNLGAWDIDYFTPIVNSPESAILGVGRIVEKMVPVNGQGVAEPRLSLSLTIDHRVIDGAPGAAFLKTVKEFIEEPLLMLE
ncbi:MAG: dihydrolipoamide acetyltransferase family protein [Thermodesulfobacteriota bacterium]